MIKQFNKTDLQYFIPNEYSRPPEPLIVLEAPDSFVETLWGDDGMVQAIICFRCYWGACWTVFTLVSSNFIPSNAEVIRDLITRYMRERKAVRLQTESRAEPILRKWHTFLGFNLEGTKRKMMFNQDYDMWAIVHEGD